MSLADECRRLLAEFSQNDGTYKSVVFDCIVAIRTALAAHDAREAAVANMVDALTVIAVYSDGPVVKGSFDEPVSARIARDALAAWRQSAPPV